MLNAGCQAVLRGKERGQPWTVAYAGFFTSFCSVLKPSDDVKR